MKWVDGRQKSGYLKSTFFQFKRLDMHLIKYPEGASIPEHIDAVEYGKHYRLNIILKQPKKGGIFKCDKTIIDWKNVKLFRSDIHKHSVTKIDIGERVVLSIGVIL